MNSGQKGQVLKCHYLLFLLVVIWHFSISGVVNFAWAADKWNCFWAWKTKLNNRQFGKIKRMFFFVTISVPKVHKNSAKFQELLHPSLLKISVSVGLIYFCPIFFGVNCTKNREMTQLQKCLFGESDLVIQGVPKE